MGREGKLDISRPPGGGLGEGPGETSEWLDLGLTRNRSPFPKSGIREVRIYRTVPRVL